MRKSFTLIELLVVIGLASLLMGIMLPAFNRMISGNAVDRAAAELKLALEQAQSIAVSSRKYTAIVLPSGATTVWTNATEQKARLGGYRFCFVEDYTNTAGTATFLNWTPDSAWKTPANGARLLAVANTPPTLTDGLFQVHNNQATSAADTLALLPASEQTSDDKSLKNLNNYESGGNAATRNNCAIIFSPYGEMKNALDVYLTVGETLVSSGNLVFPGSSNKGPVNVKALHIKRITGAVEYYKFP